MEDGSGLPAPPGDGHRQFPLLAGSELNPDGSANVGAVTATASFRFAKWLDGWFKLSGCNVIIGKGGMTSESTNAASFRNNAIYLTTVGYGTGALLGRGIKGVVARTGFRSSVWRKQSGFSTWTNSARSWSRAT